MSKPICGIILRFTLNLYTVIFDLGLLSIETKPLITNYGEHRILFVKYLPTIF